MKMVKAIETERENLCSEDIKQTNLSQWNTRWGGQLVKEGLTRIKGMVATLELFHAGITATLSIEWTA
jgi:hypothetical protein